jgi:hypothetical protein
MRENGHERRFVLPKEARFAKESRGARFDLKRK